MAAQKILIREKILKKDKASLYLLAAVMLKAKDTLAAYREKNISDEIFYATMKDITVWSENFRREKGAVGIENLSWIQNHLNCKIFRLGRLQFQPFLFYLPPYVSKKKIINADIKIGERDQLNAQMKLIRNLDKLNKSLIMIYQRSLQM